MTVRRNLLLIGNYPPPYGGVPLHIERLSGWLADRGWNCHVLSGGRSGTERIGGVTVHKPGYLRKSVAVARQAFNDDFERRPDGRGYAADHAAMVRRYRIFADVGSTIVRRENIALVASYNLLTYAPIGAWLARTFDLPHVITNFGEVFKFAEMTRHQAFFRSVADDADRLLSCSKHCGRSLALLGVDRPVEAVTYGIDLTRFRPDLDASALRTRFALSDAPIVLFVGRLCREMGLDTFLAAARVIAEKRPDAQFLIVGQDGDFATEAQRQAADWRGQMVIARNAPYDELPLYYRLADILMVPTRGDRTCSSLAGMEAMATNVAVAAFAIGGVPEIVQDDVTGLLAPAEDVAAIAADVVRLLDDHGLRTRLARAGYDQAQARLGEDHMNAAMEQHFLALLSR